ncbi:MAG: DUF4115 domain-containing protein [Acidobacteria bacterium]|nr:DUF4115 domain-containing protein [Acidobacteriota bacterium]
MAAPDRLADDFGGRLRDARERQGISLRQIANATKISVVALEALERNDVSRLPGGIFSRAFVRSYALEVGLEPEQTIREFLARFPHESVTAGHPQAAPVEDHEAVESERRMARTFLRLTVISVPIAASVLYLTMQPTPVQAPASAPASAASSAVARLPESSPDPQADVPGLPAAPAAVAEEPETADAGILLVGLLASRDCWLSMTADGADAVERLLQAGERTSIEVRRELVLKAGDAGALTLTLNGADARPLGGAGEVVTVTLSPSTFTDYLVR